MRKFYVAVALSIAAAHCAAQDAQPGCKPDGNQMEMNACAARDLKAADLQLNQRYSTLMESLPAPRRVRLRAEQRAWLKQRDPLCKRATKESEGGSIWPLEFAACLQKATEKRSRQLAQWR